MLRPVSFEALDTTLPILSRGFPAMRRGRLGRRRSTGCAVRRIRLRSAARAICSKTKGQDVGVILTIPSKRPGYTDAAHPIVNFSSWYIDPEHRWRAPRMLQTITACSTHAATPT